MDINTIKNKEARIAAMQFQKLETGLDDQFLDLVKLSDKLKKLNNDHMSMVCNVSPEDRDTLLALESKFANLCRQLEDLNVKLDKLGLDSKKFVKNQQNLRDKTSEFTKKFSDLDSDLESERKLSEISPYLKDFLPDDRK